MIHRSIGAVLVVHFAAAALAFCAFDTHAQVYKCARKGEVKYQQEPCDAASSQSQISAPDSSSGVRFGNTRPAATRALTQPDARPLPAAAGAVSTASSPQRFTAADCTFPWRNLPSDTTVFAATRSGGGGGLGFPIDESGGEANIQELVVNQPGRRIALLLSFTGPTIWHVKWTKGTEIVAVWASGHDRQAVAGLPRSIPILETTKNTPAPCGWFAFYVQNFPLANQYSQKAFNRPVAQTVMLGPDNLIGAKPLTGPLESSTDVTVQSLEHKAGWQFGSMALVKLERDGYVRKALRKELWEWQDAWAAKRDIPPVDNPQRPGQPTDQIEILVVQKTFPFPKNAHGTFLVPKGMSRPTGDGGIAGIIDWNTMTCCGGAYGCLEETTKSCQSTR